MYTMTFSRLKQLGEKVKSYLPATVTIDGVPLFIISAESDVVVISDLHIRVRNMLKAIENRARIGMSKVIKITKDIE